MGRVRAFHCNTFCRREMHPGRYFTKVVFFLGGGFKSLVCF